MTNCRIQYAYDKHVQKQATRVKSHILFTTISEVVGVITLPIGQLGPYKFRISRFETLLIGMIFAGFCTLFVDWEIHLIGKIRLFDILVDPACLALVAINFSEKRFPASWGLLALSLFFTYTAFSARMISRENFIREGLQSLMIVLFAFTVTIYSQSIDWKKFYRAFGIFCILMIAFIIIYHLSQGKLYGWKDFNATKTLFSYSLPVLFCWFFSQRKARIVHYLILLVCALILFCSGERKAQISFVECLAIATAVGFLDWKYIPVFVAIVVATAPLIAMQNPEMLRQMEFFTKGSGIKDFSYTEFMHPPVGTSPSNLQRAFINRITPDLVRAHPWFGLGTNGFLPWLLANDGKYLPKYAQLGIHNQFQNALVENGIVGFLLYATPWVHSAVWAAVRFPLLSKRTLAIYAMCIAVTFNECFFEGGGLRAAVALVVIALLPDFFRSAPARRLFRGRPVKRVRRRRKVYA